MSRLITLTTDFGSKDEYVSSVKAVIKRYFPQAEIIDISHEITPFSILEGAFVLSAAAPRFDKAVHLCVVDPGVGSERLSIALKTYFGHWLVGPDNGCLIPASERLGGIKEAYIIKPELFIKQSISSTFHGRDIFAPVAAFLAASDDASQIGELISKEMLTPSPFLFEKTENSVKTKVGNIDRFGTVRLTALFLELPESIKNAQKIVLEARGSKFRIQKGAYFSQFDKGELFFYEDSSGYYSISANQESAAKILNLCIEDTVKIYAF